MSVQHMLLYMLLFAPAFGEKKSFVVVIDTTASMADEIPILKTNIYSVLQSVHNNGDVANYILVPFSDPDASKGIRPLISQTPEGFLNFLNDVEVSGGLDCPENSLTAVEKALEISNNHSNVFLFTDAWAKDHDKLRSIQTLCRQKQSQIITFLSGQCLDGPNTLVVYYEIAKSCSGSVLNFDITNFRQLSTFNYMKEIAAVDWSNINTHKEFIGSKPFNFDVDAYTKDIVLTVSGENPSVQITDTFGRNPYMTTILSTHRAIVLHLVNPEKGEYKADIRSKKASLVTFYMKKELNFHYGFSPKRPRSIKETSSMPLPDATSYVLIENLDSTIQLFLLELQIGNEVQTLDLEIVDEVKGLYLAVAYFVANKQFRISVHGREIYEVIKGTSKTLTSQKTVTSTRSAKPTVAIIEPESALVNYTNNLTIFCKVNGFPKPDIWWEDNNGKSVYTEDNLFELPSVYISYLTINNATTNGTVYCKCKNSEGEDSLSMELSVHRDYTFNVLQQPTDKTIEYNSEGRLYCEAAAYPEAHIKWYHNETEVENSQNIEVVPDDNMLLIKNMKLEDTGEYKCEVTNEVEIRSFIAIVDISGLVAPSISITKPDQILKPGDWFEVECNVINGNPEPDVRWTKEVEDRFVDTDGIPDGVYAEGKTLKIPSVKIEHAGLYKCEASNIQGEDSKEIGIKVQYPPTIKNADEIKIVKVDDQVELLCEVDAEPKAVVHWEMYRNNAIIAFDDRHYTYGNNMHRFIANPNDSGSYRCIAENDMGRAIRTVTINVLVPPFIEPLEFENKSIRTGGSILFTCNVVLGHPVPTTRWEFVSPKTGVTVLTRNISTKLDLVLRNITKKDEGVYRCIAENEVGNDLIKVFLTVQH